MKKQNAIELKNKKLEELVKNLAAENFKLEKIRTLKKRSLSKKREIAKLRREKYSLDKELEEIL